MLLEVRFTICQASRGNLQGYRLSGGNANPVCESGLIQPTLNDSQNSTFPSNRPSSSRISQTLGGKLVSSTILMP